VKSILIVSGNQAATGAIRSCFGRDYRVDVVTSKQACFSGQQRKSYDFIFIDVEILRGASSELGYQDYKTVLQPFWQAFPSAEIIVLSAQALIREAVKAVKAGASNYLTYPVDPDEVRYLKDSIQASIRMQSELDYLRGEFWQSDALDLVRTRSPAMQKVFNKIRSVAETPTTVLLTGRTGTGKGLLARLIHQHSPRRQQQFISVHCGAIAETLLESELFGHEKGAFTGAVRRKLGKFEIAHGGTLFLDEIGTITPAMQIKLLQVLQERTFQRVGGEESIGTDVRIIAATNADLEAMCRAGSFRADLYYRLNVFPIEIPSLAERIEDIDLLVDVFLRRLNRFHSKSIVGIDPQVMEAFRHYSWPGNIRELENLIERAYILEISSVLTPDSFPSELFTFSGGTAHLSVDASLTLSEARRRGIEHIERRYLRDLLAAHQGRINQSAAAAGITARQLHKLMIKYGLRKEEFKGPQRLIASEL
jgi:DNA-binding NtrC family response regulator